MKKFVVIFLCALLAMPYALHAEEVEIQLMEVISMGFIPGDNPLDDYEPIGENPTRPTNFRATIDGNTLSVTKLESGIPSAQATVVNAATGGIVVNEQFTTSMSEQISSSGVYVLHIETATGALVGQFIVQ